MVVLGIAAFGVLGIDALRRAPSRTSFLEREPRGAVLAAWVSLLLQPLTLLPLLVWTWERELPVPRPMADFGGSPWDFDLDFADLVAAVIAGFVLVTVLTPAVAYFIGARKGSRKGPPGAFRMFVVAASIAGLAFVAGAARLALGGVPATAFETYGALVPDTGWAAGPAAVGAWRVDRVIAHHTSGDPFRDVWLGDTLETDSEHHSGSDCCGGFASMPSTHQADGVAAWWSTNPVLLRTKTDDLDRVIDVTVHPVIARDPAITPRGRPFLEGALSWAPGADPTQAVVRALPADGRPMFLLLDGDPVGVDADLWGRRIYDVGLLLMPPWWPLLLLLLGGAGAVALLRRAERTRWTEAARAWAAWLVMLPTWVMAYVYVAYF